VSDRTGPTFSAPGVALYHGDALAVLPTLPDASVDAVVTDPPAGIGFMGKEWDDFRRARNPADA
jgi:DNA modification methylase